MSASAARWWLALVAIGISLAFALVMAVLTFQFWHEAWENNWRSDTMWRARLWIPYMAMPIGLGVLTLQYVVDLVNLAHRPRAALRHGARALRHASLPADRVNPGVGI